MLKYRVNPPPESLKPPPPGARPVADGFAPRFATTLDKYMRVDGCDVRAVAEAAGVSRAAVYNWLAGATGPSGEAVARLIRFFGAAFAAEIATGSVIPFRRG